MVDPDDYLPPGVARTEPVEPTAWQRFAARYGDPLLVTAFVSAGIAVWSVAVAGRGLHPRWGFFACVLVTTGLLAAVRPAWGFAFGERWTYREDPEPSPAYLFFTRLLGVAMLVAGLLVGLALNPPAPDETSGAGVTSGSVALR